MRRPLFYLLLILFVVVGLLAAADYSSRSAACMICHQQEASFASWMTEKLRKEKRGFSHEMITCADCHIPGNPSRTMASRFRSLLHAVSYFVPQIDPRTPPTSGLFNRTRVPTENCQYCHYASVYRKAVYLKDLPEGLKPIGLVMDHRKHVLARENTCAQCHERYKSQVDATPDKGVNYAEVNHLACDACTVLSKTPGGWLPSRPNKRAGVVITDRSISKLRSSRQIAEQALIMTIASSAIP